MAKKYLEIYHQLKNDIQSGVFRDGEKLPSETQMIEKYNVSRQTVRRALALLEEDGLILKSQGSGSFVQSFSTSLMTKRIAIIVPDIEDTIFPSMMRQVDSTLFQRGYTSSFYSTESNALKERAVLEHLTKVPVDGIIMLASTLSPMCINLDLICELKQLGTKFLFFDSWYANIELSDIPLVSIENYNGAYQITEYLIQQGHERIGSFYWNNPMSMISRFSGICNAVICHKKRLDTSLFFNITALDEAELLQTSQSIDVLHTLDAFICPAGALVKPLISALQRYGAGKLRTIVVFDEVYIPQIDGIEYIILQHTTSELAQLCVDKILDMVNGLDVATTQVPWRLSELSTARNLPTSFFKTE